MTLLLLELGLIHKPSTRYWYSIFLRIVSCGFEDAFDDTDRGG